MTPAVPDALAGFGTVFVPIEPREKGTRRPRTEENLYAATDDVLEAYLDAGHNYGVACRGELAVVDADDPDRLRELIDALPDTAWQVSGSGEGEHYFYRVPGLDEDLKLFDPETDDHLGEIKAAAQSYVVGPGSVHPSGGRYGPLHGDDLATVDADEFRDALEPYLRQSATRQTTSAVGDSAPGQTAVTGDGDGADLSVYDVVSAGRYPEGERREHPFHGSDTGANFMVDDRGETFRCWRHDCTGNALHLVGVEQGVVDCGEWLAGGLDTDTWREIFAAAREAGYDLPEYEPDAEPVAVLPNLTEWNWQRVARTGGREATLSIDDARERTQGVIEDAYRSGDHRLVEALPTLGKSHGAVAAAATTGEPVTILTGRGRKEQYDQLEEWCREYGLKYYTLPSFTHHCDTANGEHGEEWAERVRDWYRRGATPQDIHKTAELELGEPLPCHREGDCPYALRWDFDPDEHDVLIGHYSHAHKSKVTSSRTVVFDEFPDAYETTLDIGLEGAISYFLACHDSLPFDDHADLLEHRRDEQRRADALAWFQDVDLGRDSEQVFGDAAGHAAAPLAVFTLLAAEDLGNGWERADLDDDRTGLYDRENGRIHLLTPPTETYHSGLVGLDGTPTVEMWELVLGERVNHRQVLTDAEREEYVRDVLDLQLVRTTEYVKPYNSADHVNVDDDAALLEAIADEHDRHPAVITTATAEAEYRDAGLLEDLVDDHQHYGNVLGSNEFATTRVGAVIGSQHYGDQYIEKWGAYEGEAVARDDGKGADLSYGTFGDRVLTHMREHETLQAAMRFGRDGNGATVYVHTDTLPEWMPVAGEGRVIRTWSDGRRQVLEAAADREEWTTAEIAADPAVDVGERQVLNILTELAEEGYVEGEIEAGGYVWCDDGLHRVSEHGEVELDTVDVTGLDENAADEIARSSSYTWNFVTQATDTPLSRSGGASDAATPSREVANGGDPPPDDPD